VTANSLWSQPIDEMSEEELRVHLEDLKAWHREHGADEYTRRLQAEVESEIAYRQRKGRRPT
jgi:hypothetical protein